MLMESKRGLYFIWVFINFSILSSFSQAQPSVSLDDFIKDYAFKTSQPKPKTGALYTVTLPSNFSGIEASIARFRSASFWQRGANFSTFYIPPRVLAMPFAKRIAIVYKNLGNLSSEYYNVPNYTLVSPVLGFRVYDASSSNPTTPGRNLNVSIRGDPIMVRFPLVPVLEDQNVTKSCVRFGHNGLVEEFSNFVVPNLCVTRQQGHYTIVVPYVKNEENEDFFKKRKWWVIGIGIGVGLILLILVGSWVYKMMVARRIRRMERESEKEVAIDSIWIRSTSKMPSATVIRTQPEIENEYVP
ncbi:Protein of unknown function DUF1191 [Dillenia turbinata]|uniref:Uncharacterized protein n=1 Tax=Dillenia turbinata TaxID=194707 RepID=A0AAN8UWT7_9MAGN